MKIRLLLLYWLPVTASFTAPRPQLVRPSTELYGLLGRFRNRRKVEQVATISPGDTVPDIDVEQLSVSEADGNIASKAASVKDVLGSSKAVLVGMPGAFTPTCSKEHLPGYIRAADTLKELGIETVAILTTNDRFVNEEWSSQQGLFEKGSILTVLSDGDGDVVKSMGLADDMGFGVGVRSKRFAMITENGQVQHVFTDEGMDDCSATSAESVIDFLTPERDSDLEGIEMDGKVIGAVGAVLVALLATTQVGGNAPSSPSRASPSPPAQSRTEFAKQARQSERTFSLINQYLKD